MLMLHSCGFVGLFTNSIRLINERNTEHREREREREREGGRERLEEREWQNSKQNM